MALLSHIELPASKNPHAKVATGFVWERTSGSEMRLHICECGLGDPKERGEGPLKSGHDVRHKELQDNDRKSESQCLEDSHNVFFVMERHPVRHQDLDN